MLGHLGCPGAGGRAGWLVGAVAAAWWMCQPSAFPDTIRLKDGSELKGVIVEEFTDRVTLNTESGERQLLTSEIDNILYDTPEQNFIRLGNLAFDREL